MRRPAARLTSLLALLALAAGGCEVGPDPAEMVLITGGEYTVGRGRGGGENNELAARKLRLKTFYIDRFPVTNARYHRYVLAQQYQPPKDWMGNTAPPTGSDHQPVAYVSWDEAQTLCQWEGKRLPTEVEWEVAARGKDSRLYPWGNTFARDKANVGGIATMRVGTYKGGASPYGVMDMVGSVWQWTSSAEGNTRTSWTDNRIVRGPPFNSTPDAALVTTRQSFGRNSRTNVIGIRCARDWTAAASPTPAP